MARTSPLDLAIAHAAQHVQSLREWGWRSTSEKERERTIEVAGDAIIRAEMRLRALKLVGRGRLVQVTRPVMKFRWQGRN